MCDHLNQPLTLEPTAEEARFFDEIYGGSNETKLVPAGTYLYHGWQGLRPVLHDQGALFVTDDLNLAETYSSFGRMKGTASGVITFRLKRDLSVKFVDMEGIKFIETFELPPHHSSYAFRLHGWAQMRGVIGVYEGSNQFILFQPLTMLDG